MSDWLNKWCAIVFSFTIIASVTQTYAACSLNNDSSFDSSTSCRDQIDDLTSDSSSYKEEALAYLSTIVASGFKAVTSASQFVRKHPLKALILFLALQNSSSPYRMAGAEALSATNINQLLYIDSYGPAVPFMPMMITSQADRLNVEFRIESRACRGCSIVSTVLVPSLSMARNDTDDVWRAEGSKDNLNTLLSRLFFVSGGSSSVRKISAIIRELDVPLLMVMGTINTIHKSLSFAGVANINQTLVYDPDGHAVRLLPITTNPVSTHANATIVLGDVLSGILMSNATILPQTFTAGTWYIQKYNISLVENVLANLIFTPAPGYLTTIYLYPTISVTPSFSQNPIKGIIILNPSALSIQTSSQPSISIPTSSASSVTSTETTVITSSSKSSSTSSKSQSTTAKVATTSLKSIVTSSATTSPSTTGSGIVVTVATNISPSSITSIDSSGVDTTRIPSTIDESTTTSEIDRSSGSFRQSTNDLPSIIGGVIGGVVLVGCAVAAGIVASMRKKSSSQENDREVDLQLPDKVKEVELRVQQHMFLNSSYAALPIASDSGQNNVNQEINSATTGAPHGPQKTMYSILPEKKHYEVALPQQEKNYDEIFSTLLKASEEGSCDLIEIHLGFGIPVDSTNDKEYTALHLAAQAGHVDACKLLISRGAHKSLMTKGGKTALMLAQDNGHKQVVEFLE